ncbi:SH3 domain-containing protein [Aestuariivita boseongensis]|uniref:SH3 domain-containing protein n=1 Tax=Aestuariivita boseongensis TaxID=1470562 RepID=UPI00068280ED|nr:SH3 domain-containing protein [Aestuariivita boseongensis]
MKRTALLASITCGLLAVGSAVHAEMPIFSATCLSNNVDADRTGTVRINGMPMEVKEFNPNYYEATMESLTISISHAGGGRDLIVSFTGSGGANGVCQVLSSAAAPVADTSTGPTQWRISVNGSLNIRQSPSTSAQVMARLPDGMIVENRGCVESGGRTWCEVADGDASGWAAREFLVAAGGENANSDDGGGAMAGSGSSEERVRFAAGTTGAEYSGNLMPGDSKRYVLGASNGQNLYFRLAANGPSMFYQIFNPDGSFLLDQTNADQEYRGQLWQSGDHLVEVINRGNGAQSYNVIFGIQ